MPLVEETVLMEEAGRLLGRRHSGPAPTPVRPVAAPRPGPRPWSDVLGDRRSVRRFTADPLSPAELAFITGNAVDMLRPEFPLAADLLTIGTTEVLGSLAPTAPVILAVRGDLVRACSPAGPGYGGLLVAAGALGYAAWLSALSVGLSASVYGATTEAAGRAGLRHLFTVAIGRAA
ncbi:hypothetical protein [Actinoplanes sp. NPDC048796]|uniref:hypothetical protein n=1 Tax=unclassified Actinoplanes TaxID=2626549 RepID=UPI00340C90F1